MIAQTRSAVSSLGCGQHPQGAGAHYYWGLSRFDLKGPKAESIRTGLDDPTFTVAHLNAL